MIAPFSRVWTLLTLLTDSELRALFAQVQQELAQRQGAGAPVLVDVLTEVEARLVAHHRAAQRAAPSPQSAQPHCVAQDMGRVPIDCRARVTKGEGQYPILP